MTITREQALAALSRSRGWANWLDDYVALRQYISQSPAQPDAQQAQEPAERNGFPHAGPFQGIADHICGEIAAQRQERQAGNVEEVDANTILRELMEADKAWNALHPVHRIQEMEKGETRLAAAWKAARVYVFGTDRGNK